MEQEKGPTKQRAYRPARKVVGKIKESTNRLVAAALGSVPYWWGDLRVVARRLGRSTYIRFWFCIPDGWA